MLNFSITDKVDKCPSDDFAFVLYVHEIKRMEVIVINVVGVRMEVFNKIQSFHVSTI